MFVRRCASVLLCAVLMSSTSATAFQLPDWYTADPLRLKMDHPKSPTWSWRWMLDVLTGVELNVSFGNAKITHKIRNELGAKIPVAHGREQIKGFGVSLLDAPRKTTIGIRPNLGFFSNRVYVRGFEQSIPWEEGADDLPGTCTDVETGEPAACRKQFDYDLTLRALYVGPQLFGALVVHNSWIEVFVLGGGALRLAELRWLRVEAGDMLLKNTRFSVFRSVTTGFALGATFPDHHLSLRISFDYDYYLKFKYPAPLQFEGPISYDEEQDIYVRPRVSMEDASVSTFTTTLAAGFLF